LHFEPGVSLPPVAGWQRRVHGGGGAVGVGLPCKLAAGRPTQQACFQVCCRFTTKHAIRFKARCESQCTFRLQPPLRQGWCRPEPYTLRSAGVTSCSSRACWAWRWRPAPCQQPRPPGRRGAPCGGWRRQRTAALWMRLQWRQSAASAPWLPGPWGSFEPSQAAGNTCHESDDVASFRVHSNINILHRSSFTST
jgi:hypothetical protein